jgi:hypothetical protein
MKDLEDVIGISARCSGVVEYGYVETIIENKPIQFGVEQHSDGTVIVFAENVTPDDKEFLKEYGAIFEIDSNVLEENEFSDYINSIYSKTGESQSASWVNEDYQEED